MKKASQSIFVTMFFLGLIAFSVPALASDIGSPSPEALKGLYPGKAYSPYAQRSFPSNVYWGDTHVHTGLSLDAGLFGNILGHEDAYRPPSFVRPPWTSCRITESKALLF